MRLTLLPVLTMDSSMLSDSMFSIVSFNLHGLNQGYDGINELVASYQPDCILVQEHWLTPDNLANLNNFDNYFVIATSAVGSAIGSGPIFGRPFGGVACLLNSRCSSLCEIVVTDDRFIVLKIGSVMVINVYLPCRGTADRVLLYEEILSQLSAILEDSEVSNCIIAGDFNVDLGDSLDDVGTLLNDFLLTYKFRSTYCLYPTSKFVSYVSKSNGCESLLDYIFVSESIQVVDTCVLDLDFNFSDHLPVIANILCDEVVPCSSNSFSSLSKAVHNCWRWDHANLNSYYDCSRIRLESIYNDVREINRVLNELDCSQLMDHVNVVLGNVIGALLASSEQCVPRVGKNRLKFWWNEELSLLKRESVDSNRAWRAAGKPRFGPLFDRRHKARLEYIRKVREGKRLEKHSYTDGLNDAFLGKNNIAFWKAWRSRFGSRAGKVVVEGSCDPAVVANKFACFFKEIGNPPVNDRENALIEDYDIMRRSYVANDFIPDLISVEMLGDLIGKLCKGKSSGPDGISNEHVLHCHPILISILSSVFNWIMFCEAVPESFCKAYTVPIPKCTSGDSSRVLKCGDFRGIAVSNIFAKLFESCLLLIYNNWLETEENQFGFKKGIGCCFAIHSVNVIVDKFLAGCDTAHIVSLDVAKAFPRVNHFALLIKLMKRGLPLPFLNLLKTWLFSSSCRVRWDSFLSAEFTLRTGLNQGSVLAPALFSVYVNDIMINCNKSCLGYILLYADDIIAVCRTRHNLQLLFNIIEAELFWLNLDLNLGKSCVLTIGPKFDVVYAPVHSRQCFTLPSVKIVRYLGIYIVAGRIFSVSLDHCKKSFNRAVNCVFGKIINFASEDVILNIIRVQCYPVLLYALESTFLKRAQIQSLDFTVRRLFIKLFKTTNNDIIQECIDAFGFLLPSSIIAGRRVKFLARYSASVNTFCKLLSN